MTHSDRSNSIVYVTFHAENDRRSLKEILVFKSEILSHLTTNIDKVNMLTYQLLLLMFMLSNRLNMNIAKYKTNRSKQCARTMFSVSQPNETLFRDAKIKSGRVQTVFYVLVNAEINGQSLRKMLVFQIEIIEWHTTLESKVNENCNRQLVISLNCFAFSSL
jgi:hypothetical protein